ncbi:MAG: tRNA (adenosine(37)-N6)-dimethylallyltransferase MiaA [Alphaproteobacteria bacterium]|nr:tRNA (adenosine(37)-N6)-dimethylallyltransferase MiaA [Alphaproteobacteria bacterium]
MSTDVVLLAGPTASGKSALALDLARRFDGIVINADAMQVYREMPVLTARPDAAAEALVPHRLYGFLSAAEACSAGRWRPLAVAEIRAAQDSGRLPIVVGGTGLYLKALTDGLSPVPSVPGTVRAAVRARLETVGAEAFHAELASRDPVMAGRLRPSDRQRLARAVEVLEATGTSLAGWQGRAAADEGFRFRTLLLAPPRDVLHAACDARFRAMVVSGALDEARAMRRLALDPALPATRVLGLRELTRHLEGGISLEEATTLAQAATRQYAKRQITWFRNQLANPVIFFEQYSERVRQEIFSKIEPWLLTPARPNV